MATLKAPRACSEKSCVSTSKTTGATPSRSIIHSLGPPGKTGDYAPGLRNPFRASFVLTAGDLLIGDVGEHEREEVDVNLASNPGGGENYGWRYREGFIQNPRLPYHPPPPDAVDPIMTTIIVRLDPA